MIDNVVAQLTFVAFQILTGTPPLWAVVFFNFTLISPLLLRVKMNYLNPECFLSSISLEVITWLDLALYTSEVSEEGETE